MGDAIEDFRALREFRKQERERLGVKCAGCVKLHPRRHASILLPGQRCRVCGYRDPRAQEYPA